MSKRKVCVVVTARPSYSRVKTALKAIQDHPELILQLVVAGSALLDRYGNAVKVIEKDGFEIAEKVFVLLEGENPTSMAKTTGLAIMELSTVFYNLKPDVVISIADRYETAATAIAASYMNIPLAHIQGGEITGNIDEKVRHAVTKLADIHLVSSDKAYERVIRMGEDPAYVFNTGCPSIDLAAEILTDIDLGFNPFDKYGGVGPTFDISRGYLVVMQHPVTNEYREAKDQVNITLEVIQDLQIPTLWFWPNVDAGADGTSSGIRAFREKYNPEHVHFFKNMEPTDFLKLLHNSKCLIGNSSVGIRECAYLGVPVVNIGTRQEGRDRGKNVIDVAHDAQQIKAAVQAQLTAGNYGRDYSYGDSNAGKKIAQVLAEVKLRFHKKLNYA
ncbi:UDP-N-acetylglucosamine 2-epimerase [Pseudocnuella soli]|uniref:UDP-N-acetylglucosamine 2-epimerase n=1 Tax=Pseudocnuella soli TaxID=2502779 RepID=UPI00105049B9|nr:UDP-N-acetylglucosamine 2-epimerase [Pseudocnuella soli]